jgi:hypothetical protein
MQAPETTVLVTLSFITTANSSVIGETITEFGLRFINITSPLQAQPADSKRAVRSHVARQSHHRRWLQKWGTTDSGNSRVAQKATHRQRDILQSQCQCTVNARHPIATGNRGNVTASSLAMHYN